MNEAEIERSIRADCERVKAGITGPIEGQLTIWSSAWRPLGQQRVADILAEYGFKIPARVEW